MENEPNLPEGNDIEALEDSLFDDVVLSELEKVTSVNELASPRDSYNMT